MFMDSLSRRRLLLGGAGLAGVLAAGPLACNALLFRARFASNPFTLGIASGDPTPDGVVLWTRLAVDPLNGGGMPAEDIPVKWRVAKDENMKQIVKSGTAVAPAAFAHSVHVELMGLEPARWYWYQFTVGDEESPIGRTRTAPARDANLQQLRFAFASCQNWQHGFFTAYQHMAKEDLELVVHLGDYIYESGIAADGPRKHNSAEPADLESYRNRYALYKTDPHLQAVHAAFPWIVTWDDHEVENNYAGMHRDNLKPPGDFRLRRGAAYQAYYEHQPLRRSAMPKGPDMLLYRRLGYGQLAEFQVLDTRQYRSPQAAVVDPKVPGDLKRMLAERSDPKRMLMGATQEKWLQDGLDKSSVRWNVIAQQIFMAQRDYTAGPDESFSMDAWDGYSATRDRLLQFIDKRRPNNPIVISGDVHANWVADLKSDFNDPKSKTLGTEFVGTSISSNGDGEETDAGAVRILKENPHIKFNNRRRGYVRCIVTPDKWQSDYRTVPFITKPDAPVETRISFIVENGKAGVQKV
jgi:alkaline phosphatase D